MSDDVGLIVEGKRYSGWKSIRITDSIESIAGSFALDVSDRWDGQSAPWPILEEDECTVDIDGEVVINGYVDKRNLSFSATSRTLGYEGRDKAAALVDCSAIVTAGATNKNRWTLNEVNVFELAQHVCDQFEIPVSLQPGLGKLLTKGKIVLSPGDTGAEVIAKAAAAAGVLVVSDGAGGLIVTRAGSSRAEPLIEGENILSGSVTFDGSNRFRRYLISSQIPATDEASGEAVRVQAEATDEGVRRTNRVLLIRPEKGYNLATSRARADWEARLRAARADKVSITVHGWRQSNGVRWPKNALVHVNAPRGLGIVGDMLISQVERSVGEGGKVTQINLVRPDAFTPEPVAAVVRASGQRFFKGTVKQESSAPDGKR